MIYASWLVILGLLTLYFHRWIDQQDRPNRQLASAVTVDGVREVSLQRNRVGHYVSPGFINGHQVEFLIDTGASDVAIPAPLAADLGLRRNTPIDYQTANGVVQGYTTVVERIELGDIVLHNVRAGITPATKTSEVLLGMSFLQDLEFTQRAGILTLRQIP